jgi:hypothetical protein
VAREIVMEVFNYVIARPWDENDPNTTLSIYTIHSEDVHQRGTMREAKAALEYVRGQAKRDGESKDDVSRYGIYVVGFTRLPG